MAATKCPTDKPVHPGEEDVAEGEAWLEAAGECGEASGGLWAWEPGLGCIFKGPHTVTMSARQAPHAMASHFPKTVIPTKRQAFKYMSL